MAYLAALKDGVIIAEKWLRYQAYMRQIPGISLAITFKGELIHKVNIGKADLRSLIPVQDNTAFRIASISKIFTTIAILQLVEQKKIGLDDRVCTHISWFSSNAEQKLSKITIRQLLSHYAGMIREAKEDYWNNDKFPSFNELKECILENPLAYDTHQIWKYSNLAFGILGQIIATVSGSSYEEYVKKNILEKADMKNTAVDFKEGELPLATGYSRKLPRHERNSFPHSNTGALAPATGFISTASDLCKFLITQLEGNDALLSDEMKKEMRRVHWIKDDTIHWGLGYHIWNFKGHQIHGHSGGFPGFITSMGLDVKEKISVVVLANTIDSPTIGFMQSIFGILYHCMDHYEEYGQNNLKSTKEYVGRFVNRWGDNYVDVVNNTPLIYNPLQFNPLDDSVTINAKEGLAFTAKGDGFGIIGEPVKLIKDKEKITALQIGSFIATKELYPEQ